jgi:hypothetical protein
MYIYRITMGDAIYNGKAIFKEEWLWNKLNFVLRNT